MVVDRSWGERKRVLLFNAGVPNLQDLMSGDLRWDWCKNNKLQNTCSTLESSWNHPSLQFVEELSSMKLVPGARKAGTAGLKSVASQCHKMKGIMEMDGGDCTTLWMYVIPQNWAPKDGWDAKLYMYFTKFFKLGENNFKQLMC